MGRVCILVAIILMFSSLSLVTARYQARQLYDQLDRYRSNSRDLEIDWRRLQLDRAAESSNAKVDRLAREELKMTGVTPERTVYVTRSQSSTGSTSGEIKNTGSTGGVR
jgi:cell division protein FtsL